MARTVAAGSFAGSRPVRIALLRLPRPALLVPVLLIAAGAAPAQELEPRALVNAPVGTNFLIASAGYAYGNLLLDPAIPIVGGTADVGTLALGYVRSVGIGGSPGR